MQKKPKKTIPLLELYAYNATTPSRMLLKKYGKADANGYEDLQNKLSELYAEQTDKKAIEKEFAQFHPHKDFILKYLTPPPVETKVIIPEAISAAEGMAAPTQILTKDDKLLLFGVVGLVSIVAMVIYTKK